jgi:hypothetical protein
MFRGSLAKEKSWGVTIFTDLSVELADNRTAIKNV